MSDWISNLSIPKDKILKEETYLPFLALVFQHLENSPKYSEAAAANWSNVADPHLIAAAKMTGAILITHETYDGSKDIRKPKSNAKIPNVAEELGVHVEKLLFMMRELHFML